MKIISYNVNGIRAAITKGLLDWLKQAAPDVICLQEIKANSDQIPTEEITNAGYPFQYYFSAQKKGYSGVAVLSKTKPNHIEYGTGIEHMDFEGRVIRVDFDTISIMSLYLPSGSNLERLEHKFMFMDDFKNYIDNLKITIPNLVICGDYNICHQAIDIHNPLQNKNTSGFLPRERTWIDQLIKSGFIDTFRHYNKEPHQYSWWSYRAGARGNNKGWRLDYCLANETLEKRFSRAYILTEAKHSDHCPVVLELD
ncbi:exodeoxyribonuclease III [uncultured Flavobacterium sp.]|uniref:exodeoxyribonuclease III n=1 Tax=uncultured Flavobacterium sp. TaxID=165435 RepID=UPI0030CA3A46|tara:strand:- start:45 stop:806 length:762 start_codon:yes stop_codon:yes gene_type:complete